MGSGPRACDPSAASPSLPRWVQAPQHLEAGQIRKPHVEDRQSEGFLAQQHQGFLAQTSPAE